jgi:hypothetical protein
MPWPENLPVPWVYHVTVWLGDQCTISLGCEVVAVAEAIAIKRGRQQLMERFVDLGDVVLYGPSVATPLRVASDGELLSERIKPYGAKV